MKYSVPIVLAYFESQGLPRPDVEFKFANGTEEFFQRKWRFDFCWPVQLVYLEVQGGLFVAGGHNRGAAMRKEHEKRNAATILGWRGLWCEPQDLCTLELVETIRKALK